MNMIDCGASIMELDFVGRPQPALPFLGKMQDVEQIYDMARDKSPQGRRDLMQLVCGILKVEVGARESELVADILIELMRQAEKDLRMALSLRLSTMENVPLRLVLQMANDEIDVARPVLIDSPVLGDFDLVYIIKSKGVEYWRAIAARKQMGDMVMDTLVETKDFEVALTILQNNAVKLTEKSLLALSDMAQGSDILSAPLLRRSEITKDIIDRLYMCVGENLKAYIRENLCGVQIDMVDEAVDLAVQDLTEQDAGGAAVQKDELFLQARDMMLAGKLDVGVMLETLRIAHLKLFRAQFAVYCGVPLWFVDEAIHQNTGQKLAVACKAHKINKPDFVSIFLLTAKARDKGRLAEVNDITRAVSYFDRVDPAQATYILNGFTQAHNGG